MLFESPNAKLFPAFNIPPPVRLRIITRRWDSRTGRSVAQRRRLFEVFVKASRVSFEPKESQASLLVNLIGSAGYEVFTTFIFAEGESED